MSEPIPYTREAILCPDCGLPHVRSEDGIFCPVTERAIPDAEATPHDFHDEPRPLNGGDVIGERYRIERTLGEGGMGWVYVATDLKRGVTVALKTLRRVLSEGNAEARFRREAVHLAAIDHPGVVRVLGFGIHEDVTAYLVLELLTGESVAERLSYVGEMVTADACGLTLEVLDILAAVHDTGVVHRDLKPSNLFLHETVLANGESERSVKLLDFGLSRASRLESVRLTAPGAVLGTPWYMAPAQVLGNVDHRVDLYATGVSLFEMLTGTVPFRVEDDASFGKLFHQILRVPAPSASKWRPDLPKPLLDFLARSLQKKADLGFQTAEQMAAALRASIQLD